MLSYMFKCVCVLPTDSEDVTAATICRSPIAASPRHPLPLHEKIVLVMSPWKQQITNPSGKNLPL